MMWFFAALVVLALGGVALVASGRGAPLADVRPDRADLDLPPGDLTAAHLRRVRFSTAVRGYRMDEVDALLTRLAAQLEATGTPARSDVPRSASEIDDGSRAAPSAAGGLDQLPADAEEFAAAMGPVAGGELDFTPASLVYLDELLGDWGRESADAVPGTIAAAGVYAGEVMVRNLPGARWTLLPEVFDDLPVVETPDGAFQNPIGKSFKRAENGPEDSIAFQFEAVAAAVARHRGDDTTSRRRDDNGEDASE